MNDMSVLGAFLLIMVVSLTVMVCFFKFLPFIVGFMVGAIFSGIILMFFINGWLLVIIASIIGIIFGAMSQSGECTNFY